jgi:hypothetical protein
VAILGWGRIASGEWGGVRSSCAAPTGSRAVATPTSHARMEQSRKSLGAEDVAGLAAQQRSLALYEDQSQQPGASMVPEQVGVPNIGLQYVHRLMA